MLRFGTRDVGARRSLELASGAPYASGELSAAACWTRSVCRCTPALANSRSRCVRTVLGATPSARAVGPRAGGRHEHGGRGFRDEAGPQRAAAQRQRVQHVHSRVSPRPAPHRDTERLDVAREAGRGERSGIEDRMQRAWAESRCQNATTPCLEERRLSS